MNRILYPNTTQVANAILDNQAIFSDMELRILLAIIRKTIGWHKETDYLSYSQLIKITGKTKKSVGSAINSLLERELIKRQCEHGKELAVMPKGFRGKIFYTLNKKANQIIKKIVAGTVVKTTPVTTNWCNLCPRTGVKTTPNKTNSYKTNNNSGAVVDKNVDKLGIKKKDLIRKLSSPTSRVSWQEWLNYAKVLWQGLGLKGAPSPSFFRIVKHAFVFDQRGILSATYSAVADARPDNPEKYFFKVFNQKLKKRTGNSQDISTI